MPWKGLPRVIVQGDCVQVLRTLEAQSVQCCVTSPPYWGLRDYGVEGQLGLEKTPEEYVDKMVEVFREVKRVLRDDGTLFLNLGDSYFSGASRRDVQQNDKAYKAQLDSNDPDYVYLGPCDVCGGYSSSDISHNDRPLPESYELNDKTDRDKLRPGFSSKVSRSAVSSSLASTKTLSSQQHRAQDIIWHKPNPMPESVRDRCTKAHEYIFLLSKRPKYYFDGDAIREPALTKGVI